ncbi:MAG: SMI1/KNR4 family protein [Lachnospiraceae bacterium]|nr:SMI1/KNR4 family protein [Lachnospiraceae bacterium]
MLMYLNKTNAEYELNNEDSLDISIPEAMKEFYSSVKYADFSFGRIYDMEEALKMSERAPFSPDWFVLGQDNYFSYWLCKKEPNEKGKVFTTWDHASGIGIDEPVWDSLLTFLERMAEDASEYEEWDDEFEDDEWEE